MRGVDIDDRQLRDDLMTMLIAGHETTAAVLTWAVFLLSQNPEKIRKAQAEIDAVLGQGPPTYESMKNLEYIRLIVVEVLRLYPHHLCSSDALSNQKPYLEDTKVKKKVIKFQKGLISSSL
ncbi:unnamed protein product [Arabidopsis halleri]